MTRRTGCPPNHPGGACLIKAGDIRVDYSSVAVKTEDECDVDADPASDRRSDGMEALDSRRNFDEGVRAVDLRAKTLRLVYRGCGVMRRVWAHFYRHPAVPATSAVIDWAKDVGGSRHVVCCDLEDGLGNSGSGHRQSRHLRVMGVTLRQSGREDRGVRGDPDGVPI